MKSKYISKRVSGEDDDEVTSASAYCGYFKSQKVTTKMVVYIDEEFREASYYRLVCDAIEDLSEDDIVEFHINSPGGDLDGLVALLSAIDRTDATTIAVLKGEIHSAASLLAVSCDGVEAGEYANMLCHFIRYGARGKGNDVYGQVLHTNLYAEKLMRNAYAYFLTDDEIAQICDGKELWLDSEQINQRFKKKFDALNAMNECEGCCGDPDNCSDICACPLAEDE